MGIPFQSKPRQNRFTHDYGDIRFLGSKRLSKIDYPTEKRIIGIHRIEYT